MDKSFDYKAEAKAADALVKSLVSAEAPQVLVEQARQQATWLREQARKHPNLKDTQILRELREGMSIAAETGGCVCIRPRTVAKLIEIVRAVDLADFDGWLHPGCTDTDCKIAAIRTAFRIGSGER